MRTNCALFYYLVVISFPAYSCSPSFFAPSGDPGMPVQPTPLLQERMNIPSDPWHYTSTSDLSDSDKQSNGPEKEES